MAGAIREDEERADARHAVDQGGEELLGGGVDPVQVLDDHDLGAGRRRLGEKAANGVQRLATALPRAHRGHRRVPRIHGEQGPQVWRHPGDLPAEGGDAALDLQDDGGSRVALLDREHAPQQVDERVERHGAPEGEALSLEPSRAVVDLTLKLVEEPRLADARLAHNQHHLALSRLGAPEAILQDLKLALAPHERREPPLGLDVEPGARDARGHHEPRRHRLALPLERERPQGPGLEVAADGALDRFGDDDLARGRRLQEPGGHVGGVPDRGVVHAEVAADAADHHQARVEALAHLELDAALLLELGAIAGHGRADTEGRVHRSLRVILVGDGRAEQRHDPVAEELVHGALVPVHLGQHQLEGAGHEGVDLLGIEARGDRGEAGDVHEEHRDLLALALQRGPGGEDVLGKVLGGVRLRGRRTTRGRRVSGDRLAALEAEAGAPG